MNEPDNVTYEFGPFRLEPHARRLSRDGESVPLAAAEFELLLLLVRNRGRVVEKKEIMASVWMDGLNLGTGFDVNMLDPSTILAVEWYSTPAMTPVQFSMVKRGASHCAVLFIWTL